MEENKFVETVHKLKTILTQYREDNEKLLKEIQLKNEKISELEEEYKQLFHFTKLLCKS